MSDIVERLRDFNTAHWPLLIEAADEIERLRAELKECEGALDKAGLSRLR